MAVQRMSHHEVYLLTRDLVRSSTGWTGPLHQARLQVRTPSIDAMGTGLWKEPIRSASRKALTSSYFFLSSPESSSGPLVPDLAAAPSLPRVPPATILPSRRPLPPRPPPALSSQPPPPPHPGRRRPLSLAAASHHHHRFRHGRFSSSPSDPFDSSRSGSSNPFAGPSIAVIRDIPIAERVPVTLSTTAANFFPWKTYFGLLFREYDLLDHVDGTIDLLAMPHDPEWLAIDATIIRWFYQTVANDIFRTVVQDGDSAHTEFFGTHQNDHSLDEYVLKLKSLSDELRDLEFPIDDKIMLSTLSAGLGEDLSNAASNLTLLTTPSFEQAVAYLRLEHRRLKHLRARAAHTAFVASLSGGAQAPAPCAPAPAPAPRPMGPPPGFHPSGHQAGPTGPWAGPTGAQAGPTGSWTGQAAAAGGGRRGHRRRGGGGNGGANATAPASRPPQHTAPTPPWIVGHNPWTGVVHAYSMPVSRAPYPGIMGPRPATHQAFYAAPQPAPAYAAPLPPELGLVGPRAPDRPLERPHRWGVWWRWRLVHGHRRLRAHGRAPR
ncbi:hypothetical protein QYE76_067075 [Lolium multiflorum]|uniref:Uncharacterized protein n=1 Tax=Lolium multiflorum TaxID=4521 RepID=A0AAD8SC35_LOLMU|nr:hypothetical protein QYE76_067075 [Lolium multiflorum]